MKENRILIINDVTGYGRVSSVAMNQVLTSYGLHPYLLPTAIVSNTMDYGSSVILDTTDFMKNCITKWQEFGFSFPVIASGMINSSEQIEIISDLIDSQDNPFVLVDPIMADDGKLYPGMYEGAVDCYRRLAARANLIIPNFTEATMMAGMFESRKSLSMEEYGILIRELLKLGARDIVITGCIDENGTTFNLAYDSESGVIKAIEYNRIDIDLIGTGDVFSATLIAELMNGSALFAAVEQSSTLVRRVAEANLDNPDHFDINIETTLQEALHEIRQR